MKLGISMWSYFRDWKNDGMDIPAFIRNAKELGADGVELLDFFWNDIDSEIGPAQQALAETGLPVGVYSTANNFVDTDPAAREAELAKITTAVDVAITLSAKVVRVFAGNAAEGIEFDDAFNWIVEGLSEAARYAKAKGIKLALENHGALAGRSDQVMKIISAVANPSMCANPDTGNFLLVHQAPHVALQEVAPYAAMVHFKDFAEVPDSYEGFAYTSLDGLKFKGVALGEGDVALQDCVQELHAAGFDGWVNIEYEGEEPASTSMPRSIAYARKVIAAVTGTSQQAVTGVRKDEDADSGESFPERVEDAALNVGRVL